MNDEALARELMGPGRASALAEIARRFGEPILIIALKWYRLGPLDAEEVLNDTQWDAVRSADRFDSAKGTFRSWLIGIACNRARRRRVRRKPPLPFLQESRTPEDELLLEEARQQIELAARDMTPLQQDIIEAMLDRGPEEVTDRMLADRHRTTPGTVKVERFRVRRRLAELFKVFHA